MATHHLSNGVDVDKFDPQNHDPKIYQNLVGEYSCVFLYAELHGIAQGLEQIILANVKNENPQYKIVFIGDGPEKEKILRINYDLSVDNVEFREPVTRDRMPILTASTDVALIPLKKHLTGAVPSKLYEAMASGVPVIIIDDGEGADIVASNECGLVVKPGDLNGLSKAFKILAEDVALRKKYGQEGRNTAKTLFNRKQIVRHFIGKLAEVAAPYRKM